MLETFEVSSNTTLMFGFLMGLLHACDADHLLTVSTLSAHKHSRLNALYVALSWAIGHGIMLFILGLGLLVFRWEVAAQWQLIAERSVAVFLVIMGVFVIYSVLTKRSHVHAMHAKTIPTSITESEHRHESKSMVVGAFHGLAGSAPVLALLPFLTINSVTHALGYLFLFSLGVLIAMLLCGGFFAGVMMMLKKHNAQFFQAGQLALGCLAVICGTLLYTHI